MQFVLIFQFPLVAHIAVLLEAEYIKLIALMLLVIGIQYQGLLALKVPAIVTTSLVTVALGIVWVFGWIDWLVYLTPTLVPVVLLLVFGSTLLPGHEPLVTAIGERARGPLSSGMRAYTRAVTWLWTLLFAALIAESVVVLLAGSDNLRSWTINIVNPVIISLVFVVEFIYRKRRFPEHAHPTFREYLNIVRSRDRS